MSSKRKIREIDDKSVKMRKQEYSNDISSYIEQERKKLLTDIDSTESIEKYLHQNMKRLKENPSSLVNVDHLLINLFGIEPYNLRNMNTFKTPMNSDGTSFHSIMHHPNGASSSFEGPTTSRFLGVPHSNWASSSFEGPTTSRFLGVTHSNWASSGFEGPTTSRVLNLLPHSNRASSGFERRTMSGICRTPGQDFMQEYNHMRNLQDFNAVFHSTGNIDSSSSRGFRQIAGQLYKDSLQHNQTGTSQDFNMEFDPLWDTHFHNCTASTVSEDTLLTQLVDIFRDWDIAMYQKCMGDYKVVRNRNPEFWDEILLKVFPPVMLEHCTNAEIVADFFHTMCKYSRTVSILVRIKPCYLQFFLMNMAAVNRIEFSLSIETEIWNSAKQQLIERAFVAGQTTNLQLLLQYFRPKDLWTCCDMEFLNIPKIAWETRSFNIANVVSGYYEKLTLLNLVRLATHVAKSSVPKNMLTDCIRLLWRASEMPYVALEDIDDAFKPLESSMLVRHLLISACKDLLLEVYPKDCFAIYQPRSLMHLSRCKVRQTVTSGIHTFFLPIPNRMKSYINLEW